MWWICVVATCAHLFCACGGTREDAPLSAEDKRERDAAVAVYRDAARADLVAALGPVTQWISPRDVLDRVAKTKLGNIDNRESVCLDAWRASEHPLRAAWVTQRVDALEVAMRGLAPTTALDIRVNPLDEDAASSPLDLVFLRVRSCARS